jgi:hypothetical protein
MAIEGEIAYRKCWSKWTFLRCQLAEPASTMGGRLRFEAAAMFEGHQSVDIWS